MEQTLKLPELVINREVNSFDILFLSENLTVDEAQILAILSRDYNIFTIAGISYLEVRFFERYDRFILNNSKENINNVFQVKIIDYVNSTINKKTFFKTKLYMSEELKGTTENFGIISNIYTIEEIINNEDN